MKQKIKINIKDLRISFFSERGSSSESGMSFIIMSFQQFCFSHYVLLAYPSQHGFHIAGSFSTSQIRSSVFSFSSTIFKIVCDWQAPSIMGWWWVSNWAWEAGQWAAVADTGGYVWKLPFKTMLCSEWRQPSVSATCCGSETPKYLLPGSCLLGTLLLPRVKGSIW